MIYGAHKSFVPSLESAFARLANELTMSSPTEIEMSEPMRLRRAHTAASLCVFHSLISNAMTHSVKFLASSRNGKIRHHRPRTRKQRLRIDLLRTCPRFSSVLRHLSVNNFFFSGHDLIYFDIFLHREFSRFFLKSYKARISLGRIFSSSSSPSIPRATGVPARISGKQ